jgi:hypothetical protein
VLAKTSQSIDRLEPGGLYLPPKLKNDLVGSETPHTRIHTGLIGLWKKGGESAVEYVWNIYIEMVFLVNGSVRE